MSLYWNDIFWYFEKNSTKTARDSNFVLVTKLFVGNITAPLNQKGSLHKRFKIYGRIKNIEIFKEIYNIGATGNQEIPTFYAYVTFEESKSAHLAIKDPIWKRKFSAIKIVPADTWKQPVNNKLPAEKEDLSEPNGTSMTDLNDDCLLGIFNYMDLDTLTQVSNACTRFHHLIDENFFSRYKTIVFNFNRNIAWRKAHRVEKNVELTTLSKMRNQLLAVGQYVTDARFIFNESMQFHLPHIMRVMDVFTGLLGDNVESLTVVGVTMTQRMSVQFRPILKRLKYLEWRTHDFNPFYKCDLVNLCKNVVTLELSVGLGWVDTVNNWEKLENVRFQYISYEEREEYVTFLKNNPNLKSYRFCSYNINDKLFYIALHLKHLEKLVVDDITEEIQASTLTNVIYMKNLKTLKLLDMHEDYADEIIEFLCKLTALNYVKVMPRVNNFDQDTPFVKNAPIIHHNNLMLLAKSLTDLKKLVLRRFRISNKTILEFLYRAKHLEIFDVRECVAIFNLEDVEDIYNTIRGRETVLSLLVDDLLDEEKIRKMLRQDDVKRALKIIKVSSNGDKIIV